MCVSSVTCRFFSCLSQYSHLSAFQHFFAYNSKLDILNQIVKYGAFQTFILTSHLTHVTCSVSLKVYAFFFPCHVITMPNHLGHGVAAFFLLSRKKSRKANLKKLNSTLPARLILSNLVNFYS